jgi:hypothetical protein
LPVVLMIRPSKSGTIVPRVSGIGNLVVGYLK